MSKEYFESKDYISYLYTHCHPNQQESKERVVGKIKHLASESKKNSV